MKIKIGRYAIVFVPIIIGISLMCAIYVAGGKFYVTSLFESEQDYKLKFVDSTDYLSLIETNTAILPFEIISVDELDEGIVIKTYENAVIFAPLECEVVLNDSEAQMIELKSGELRIIFQYIISGVKVGNKISCGEVIGTVDGNFCMAQVFLGAKKLTLQELKAVL